MFRHLCFSDCQGTFFPECQRLIRSASKEIGIIQCWGKPLYAYCKATDGTVFPILGYKCEHSTCPDDAKGQIATGEFISDINYTKLFILFSNTYMIN